MTRESPFSESAVVVIPTFNEALNIVPICQRIMEHLPNTRILVVDDNSPDGTGALVEQLAREQPKISLLTRKGKEGLGAAYVTGFMHVLHTWPHVDFVIQMDADFSHDPAALPGLLELCQDNDLVIGSRYVQGISIVNWPLHRLIVSKLGTAYARTVTGLPISDATSGFKCYRSSVLRALQLERIRSNGYVFQVESSFKAWRLGFRLKDYPIVFYERQRGESKLHLNIALEAFVVILRLGLERFLRPRIRPWSRK